MTRACRKRSSRSGARLGPASCMIGRLRNKEYAPPNMLVKKSGLFYPAKHPGGSLDHLGRDRRPLFLVERDAPYDDLDQDQNMEKPCPPQARLKRWIGFSFAHIAFQQLRLGLFNA